MIMENGISDRLILLFASVEHVFSHNNLAHVSGYKRASRTMCDSFLPPQLLQKGLVGIPLLSQSFTRACTM
jgi:hypothetical protein